MLDGHPTCASAEKLEKDFQKNTALCCSARVFCFFTGCLFSFLNCISVNALSSPVWLPTSHSLFNLNFRKTFAISHLLKHCEVFLRVLGHHLRGWGWTGSQHTQREAGCLESCPERQDGPSSPHPDPSPSLWPLTPSTPLQGPGETISEPVLAAMAWPPPSPAGPASREVSESMFDTE